ncbi:MAG: response regulator [Thiolinea sp.]
MTQAESGEQALQLVQEQTSDVVLSDLRMHGMDGTELLAALASYRPPLNCRRTSGAFDSQQQEQLIALGANTCLGKLIHLRALRSTLGGGGNGNTTGPPDTCPDIFSVDSQRPGR